jgi:hypothetical protein
VEAGKGEAQCGNRADSLYINSAEALTPDAAHFGARLRFEARFHPRFSRPA